MWEQIRANKRKSVVLVIVIAALLLVVGFFLGELFGPGGGKAGVLVAAGLWFVLTLISYYGGGDIFLSMSGATKIERKDHPRLFNVVEEMCIASGLAKMPDIYIIDERSPNAFATGRDPNHAAVAVTAGLLSRLSRDELQGVIAHEISHVKNRDILLMIMTGVMVGTIVILADIGWRVLRYGGTRSRRSSKGGGGAMLVIFVVAIVLMILAPLFAQLIYFAISRKREYLADASGAQLTRYPEGLASALEKISSNAMPMESANRVTAPMYIINPLEAAMGASGLGSTHPPIEERVKILRSMGSGVSYADYDRAYKKFYGGDSSIIPARSLQAATPVKARAAFQGAPEEQDRVALARETSDMLWLMNDYRFISCPCGTKLKIPPEFAMPTIACPRCKTEHPIGRSE